MMPPPAVERFDTVSQMASILRICAATMRDIATTQESRARVSILRAAEDADRAAGLLEECGQIDADDRFENVLGRLRRQ